MIKFKDEVLQKKVVVHCDEEWKAENLLKWADSKGLKWVNGDSYLEYTEWDIHEYKTCYLLSKGEYSYKDYYDSHGYKVIPYEQAIKESEMKRGDRVYVSNESIDDALNHKKERIFLAEVGGSRPFVCVDRSDNTMYPDGDYDTAPWKYAVPKPESSPVTELTMAELQEKLGFEFKLVKGK